jgi:hypothetical protein
MLGVNEMIMNETPLMTGEQFDEVMFTVENVAKCGKIYCDDPILDPTEYDKIVQATLDEYWPGTTELTSIKRALEGLQKTVYTAKYQGNEVIIKAVKYSDDRFADTERFDRFLGYIDQGAKVAPYIAPSVEKSAHEELIITMSEFSVGQDPRKLEPEAPFTWIYDEGAVRTQAKWFADFRAQSIKYTDEFQIDY